VKSKLYEIIEGNDILNLAEEAREALIEGMLYPQDYVILVAEEKVGKTIFAQQLACNMTTGESFLDSFDITRPLKVWYFVTEGRVDDIKDRFIRMSKKISINTINLTLIPTYFRFNTNEGWSSLNQIMDRFRRNMPDVVIIDALYRAIKGSIKDDNTVNEFHFIIGRMMQILGCAVILVHHMTKPQRDQAGKYISRSDKDTFGSAFLSAAVDHIFWLEKWHKDREHPKDRMLKCETQRGGKIITDVRIRLNEPEPLYFEMIEIYHDEAQRIMDLLTKNKNGLNVGDLELKLRLSKATIYRTLKILQKDNRLAKTGTKTKFYKLKYDR